MNKIKNFINKIKSMWYKAPDGRYLTIKESGAFGLYALGNSFMVNAVMYVVTITFIPYFYGIDALHAYIIMILGNGLNMLLSPLLGNLMEKTHTKFGKYKPYILLCLPIFATFAMLSMWIPQFDIENSRIIYAYITCVPVIAISTFANNMFQTMPNVITPNGQERADIMTPVGLLVGLAPSILQIIAGPIRGYFKEVLGAEYLGLRIIGVISVILGIICVLFIIKVKERVYELDVGEKTDEKTDERLGFFTSFKLLFKNKPLMILFIALVAGSLREFWKLFLPFIIQFRFATNIKTALDISGLPIAIIGFASTISMAILPIITRKMNKHHAIIVFSVMNLLATAILGFVGFENIPIGAISAVVITLVFFLATINPTYLLIPLLLGELADYQQLKTGKRLEGHLQNFLFTMPLLISQILMLGAWKLQSKIGFEPKDYVLNNVLTDAQQAISNKWFDVACIISAVSTLFMMIILFFYPLTRKKYNEIALQLQEMSIKLGGSLIEDENDGLNQ